MSDEATAFRMLALLADLLDYPRAGLAAKAERCQRSIATLAPEAAEALESFRDYLESAPLATQEEGYSAFFDLNPLCHPYVGYHLFGETYKRSLFLVGLKERYEAAGFRMDASELPDRVSVVLRFLAASRDPVLNREIINEALVPALERMGAVGRANRPPAAASACSPELEGHSHGEVLEGGFLLSLSQSASGSGENPSPYWRLLHAARLAVRALGAFPAAAGSRDVA